MSSALHQPVTPSPTSEKASKYATPPGHRVLHLVIDQETFDSLHVNAIKSRMKFTAYMQRFLQETFPYIVHETPPSAPLPNEE